MKKIICAILIAACVFFLFRTNDKTQEKQTFEFEEIPEFVRKIEQIPDDAEFIFHFRHRVFLTSNEELFLEKYGDTRHEKVEKLRIGHKDMFDVRTYRVANEEERDIVFKAREDLEFTDIYIAEAAPAGDSFYLEFFWDDEELEMHVSLANNGMMIESVKKGEKWQVTCVFFNAPHAKEACELFESLYKN
ncbi:MAG: hypothetical protein IJE55_05420 [Clostridia bacterium]|nr:hypothetical protein [Clostridia bacterium]